jgi:Domain of unknown function (DUF4279)
MSQSKAGSKVAEMIQSGADTYAVALRVRHASLDPAVLTETLRLEPAHSWKAGDPRVSQTGAPLGGQHRDSYWSAPLPIETTAGAAPPLEVGLSQQLLQLSRHRDFFKRLEVEGAEMSLVLEVSPVAGSALTFSPVLVRRLAELNLEMELQFIGD